MKKIENVNKFIQNSPEYAKNCIKFYQTLKENEQTNEKRRQRKLQWKWIIQLGIEIRRNRKNKGREDAWKDNSVEKNNQEKIKKMKIIP